MKSVVLLSGGLDSLTCLALAMTQCEECVAMSFNYQQRHSVELEAAKKIAAHYDVLHIICDLPALGQMGGSALTDQAINVPDYVGDHEIPVTYVPARNIIFLSLALGYAEALNASQVYIGASSVDYSGYPDCRPEFIDSFQQMVSVGTKAGVEGQPVQIIAPLMHLSKAKTIELGLSLGVDYSMSISCYQADAAGKACGRCDSCVLRKKGFEAADVKDPTVYQGING